MIKNYFRILKKPHAYLQTILKTPVKFQKDRTETVGEVKGTKYPLKTRNHAPRTTRHAPRATRHAPRPTPHANSRKPKTVSLHFSSKRRGTIFDISCKLLANNFSPQETICRKCQALLSGKNKHRHKVKYYWPIYIIRCNILNIFTDGKLVTRLLQVFHQLSRCLFFTVLMPYTSKFRHMHTTPSTKIVQQYTSR